MDIKDVIAEDEGGGAAGEELLADEERLGEPGRPRLLRIGEGQPPLRAGTEELLEISDLAGCRDDQHLANARHYQNRERVEDHRFVVDEKEVLVDGKGCRIQAGPGPAR